MSTMNFMCSCCGAPLAFSGDSDKLECASCGNVFEAEDVEAVSGGGDTQDIRFEQGGGEFGEGADMQAYTCKNCGAELMTDGTTTATECPYCGSPTILPDRIAGGVKPEWVVPFKVTREEAQKKFEDYFNGKRMLPNVFRDSANRIAEMKKMYVPYWLFDCDARADIVYQGTKKKQKDNAEVVEHYAIRRAGSMRFEAIPVNAGGKLDAKISESLEPYDLTQAVPFQPAVLSGAMADRADIPAEQCEGRAVERVEKSMEQAIRNTVSGYDDLTVKRRNVWSENGVVTPALMPVWLITTQKEENGQQKTYTFAVNGQTGELTCDVQPDSKKKFGWFAATFAGVTAGGYLLLVLLRLLNVLK